MKAMFLALLAVGIVIALGWALSQVLKNAR